MMIQTPQINANSGRRGGEVGREGGGRAGEEAEEVEGRHRGAGEGAGVARTAVGLRHHPQVARREATGESRKQR